jgi:hypothetical protein
VGTEARMSAWVSLIAFVVFTGCALAAYRWLSPRA